MKVNNLIPIYIIIIISCTTNNIEPENNINNCDIYNNTFDRDIKPIFEKKCVECHTNNNPQGNFEFDSWIAIKQNVQKEDFNTFLIKDIENHSFKHTNKFNNCEIDKIKFWISQEYPNN